MMQSFDTQLQVSLRALRDVIAPALSNCESHIIEQLNLTIATLEFSRQRLPYSRSYHRLELSKIIQMAAAIRDIIGRDQEACHKKLLDAEKAANTLLNNPEAEVENYLQKGRELRELITISIQNSANKPYEKQLDNMVVCHQETLLYMQRVWCAPFGLDTETSKMQDIEQLLIAEGIRLQPNTLCL